MSHDGHSAKRSHMNIALAALAFIGVIAATVSSNPGVLVPIGVGIFFYLLNRPRKFTD